MTTERELPPDVVELLGNICHNLNDMPISEGWARRTAAKILALLSETE